MTKLQSILLAIFLGIAMAMPATPTDLEPAVRVSVQLDTQIEQFMRGDPVTLRCIVEGIEGEYQIQWQCSEDEEEWFDIDCHDEIYTFILDETTAGMYYRVVVTCDIPEEKPNRREGPYDSPQQIRQETKAQEEDEATAYAEVRPRSGAVPPAF